MLNIYLPNQAQAKVEIMILDIAGKLILTQSRINTSSIEVGLDQFPAGLYQVIIRTSGNIVGKRFIIQRPQ